MLLACVCYHRRMRCLGISLVARQHGLYRMEVFEMTIGPATIMGIIAAALATLLWWLAVRLALPAWVGMFLFGVGLALVILAGPLIKLP